MSEEKQLTPLMRQYFDVKQKYPDTILLFQVGDFYELFFDDAVKASAILGIALTKRGFHKQEPIPLCGVPLHVLDHYLSKLVRAGYKVALCEQLELPRPGKLVDRAVTQVLTPGTLTDSKLLDDKSASYLCVFFPTELSWTMLCVELLTGQLFATIFTNPNGVLLDAELSRFMPDEIVVPATKLGSSWATKLQGQGYALSQEPFDQHRVQEARAWFEAQPSLQHSGKTLFADSVNGTVNTMFSDTVSDSMTGALTLLYTYLLRNNEQGLAQLKQFSFYKPEDYLMLDASTVRNLELVKNMQDGSSSSTLFSVLDRAVTAMGSRMLKKWLLRPLIKPDQIEKRLSAVELLVKDHPLKKSLNAEFNAIGDLERIVGRIALKRARLYDYRALIDALGAVPMIKALLMEKEKQSAISSHEPSQEVSLLSSLAHKIDNFHELFSLLWSSIAEDPQKDWLIKEGFSAELDRLRSLVHGGAQEIAALEAREQERTGITSLKIRYNNVHGYGIEVTNPNLHLVPADYLRTQTLANRERFTMQQLKDLEHDLQRANSEISQVEKVLFDEVKTGVEQFIPQLKKLSLSLASIDALISLADVAYEQKYVRPTFNDDQALLITDGRHPVVEKRLQSSYIPNSVDLSDDAPLWLITGPNMGGKSTFLRQIALTVHMAQMGSFVPAAKANLSIVDRIFTRIGASDNVAEGKSTFLVEMEETALVCSQATRQSLVILDEVGRGTSTFDGLAIAQAVVEYIYTTLKARCLFATHYHELMELCAKFPGMRPYHAASMKTADGIVLLHKILPGVADGSFGLEVAQMANLPAPIIARAREIIATLSHESHALSVQPGLTNKGTSHESLSTHDESPPAFKASQRIVAEIERINVEEITPKQALDVMWHLKGLLEETSAE